MEHKLRRLAKVMGLRVLSGRKYSLRVLQRAGGARVTRPRKLFKPGQIKISNVFAPLTVEEEKPEEEMELMPKEEVYAQVLGLKLASFNTRGWSDVKGNSLALHCHNLGLDMVAIQEHKKQGKQNEVQGYKLLFDDCGENRAGGVGFMLSLQCMRCFSLSRLTLTKNG